MLRHLLVSQKDRDILSFTLLGYEVSGCLNKSEIKGLVPTLVDSGGPRIVGGRVFPNLPLISKNSVSNNLLSVSF